MHFENDALCFILPLMFTVQFELLHNNSSLIALGTWNVFVCTACPWSLGPTIGNAVVELMQVI